MKNYAVSVIIPVYNGEKYIGRCLNSIVSQTLFDSLQVILINDGSTDHSFERMQVYAAQHANIEVISIENTGVSNARNIGIQNAKGEYVAFVDADDWVDADCYERMYGEARMSGAEIVSAGLYVNDDVRVVVERRTTETSKTLTQEEMLIEFLREKMDGHCFNKLFAASVVKNQRFDTKLRTAEDRLFLFQCLLNAKSMYMMKESYYHYYQNENSVMHQKSILKNLDGIIATQKMLEETRACFPELTPYAEAMYAGMACRLYCELEMAKEQQNVFYGSLKETVKKYSVISGVKYMTKKHLVGLVLAKISPSLYNGLRNNTFIRFMR